ncbi:MAG: ABC transporter permease [Verrucomicrobia bacterium]|nr:MAG: ABC transporter permease [Verrucomicrobiota bacterium]
MSALLQDVRFASRMLLKQPGFAIIAVLTLALGIGGNTAIFSVVNAVLLRPLPFPQPEQVIAVGTIDTRQKQHRLGALSYPDFFDIRDQNRTLNGLALYRDRNVAFTSNSGAMSLRSLKVSAEFFEVLGINPMIGRGFRRVDEQAGGGPGGFKVVLSHDLWQTQFGGDRNILGQTIELDRQQYTIIGVMPAGFQFPIQADPLDLYITIACDAVNPDGTTPATEQRGDHSLFAIARLKAGVTIRQAQTDLCTIAAKLERQYPDTNSYYGVALKPLREQLIGDVRTAVYVLFAAVICVLLIANANIANLLLARATVREKEIALRAALGASRPRIVRQLLTETLLLAGSGGILGLLIGEAGTEALIKTVPQNIPRISEIRLDGAVLGFTLLVSVATALLFGVVPAWQASRVDLNTSLKSGMRTSSGGEAKGRLRNGLVMAEVAVALVLLICASLLIQTFARLGRVPSGVQTERLLTARCSLPATAYPKNDMINAFFDQLLMRIRAQPGVKSASTITPLPLSGSNFGSWVDIEERPLPQGQRPIEPVRIVGTDYFHTMGIPVRQGRAFDERDRYNSAPVAIVNERFAQKYFPGQNAIGKRIMPSWSADNNDPKIREIVGVVGNVKYRSLESEDQPEMYLPHRQIPLNIVSLVVRTNVANPSAVTSQVRGELAALDNSVPLTNVRTFDEYVSTSLARPRFNALLLSIFAVTALVLTAIGIYGVMAYSVAQRTNEIGIRIALGAAQSSIFRLVVGQAMGLVAISVVVGLSGAFAMTRLLQSLLFGVDAWDPLTFSGVIVLIALVAFLAAWFPARRASTVDPIIALRAE